MLCYCFIKGFELTLGAPLFFWVSLQCCVVLSSCSFCFIICSIILLCYCCSDFLSCFVSLLLLHPLMFHIAIIVKTLCVIIIMPSYVAIVVPSLHTHIICVVLFTLCVHISHYCCCAFLSCFTLPILPFMYMLLHNVNVPLHFVLLMGPSPLCL